MADNDDTRRFPLLMTRPAQASRRFVGGLPPAVSARLSPVYAPLMDIVPRDGTPALGVDDAAILTSAHGARLAPPGDGRVAYCVGEATTTIAGTQGWTAVMAGGNADELVAHLVRLAPEQRLFHLSGAHTRGRIAERLNAAGIPTGHHVIYDQPALPLGAVARDLLCGTGPVIVPLFSPRTADILLREAPTLGTARIIALSDAVARVLDGNAAASIDVALMPDAAAMGRALALVLDRLEGGGTAE